MSDNAYGPHPAAVDHALRLIDPNHDPSWRYMPAAFKALHDPALGDDMSVNLGAVIEALQDALVNLPRADIPAAVRRRFTGQAQ